MQLKEAEAARKAVCSSHDELAGRLEDSNEEVNKLAKMSREKEEELGICSLLYFKAYCFQHFCSWTKVKGFFKACV